MEDLNECRIGQLVEMVRKSQISSNIDGHVD